VAAALCALLLAGPALAAGTPAGGEEAPLEVRLSFAGDCMLATAQGQSYQGSLNWYAQREEPTYFLEKVADIFASDDFTVVNLENVLTDRPLQEVEKSTDPAYWFRGPASNAEILARSSVEAVSLANNHTGDYGPQGLRDTKSALEAAELPYGTNEETVYLEKEGFTVALICNGLWNEAQARQIIRRIEEASEQSDYQIVFFHGGKEGVHKPEEWKIRAARSLVDAGADLVIGNHPHVLQPAEVYHGVNIVYSLGNFCYGGHRRPENRTVIYQMTLTVEEGGVTEEANLIPCCVYTGDTNNWQPAPIEDGEARQAVLDFMAGERELPY